MDWLLEYLNDLLCFFEARATEKVDYDLVTPEDGLREGSRLLVAIKNLNGGVWYRDSLGISLYQGTHEFIRPL